MAITNKEINLLQLDKETGGQGLIANFNDLNNKLIMPANNNNLTEAKLEAAILTHNAIDVDALALKAKAAAQAKLAALGLTTDDLKALGL